MSHARSPKGRFEPNGHCCSTLELIYWSQGESGMKSRRQRNKLGQDGWKISEVERLTGLSRRDNPARLLPGRRRNWSSVAKRDQMGIPRVLGAGPEGAVRGVPAEGARHDPPPGEEGVREGAFGTPTRSWTSRWTSCARRSERNVSRYHKALALGHAKDRDALERLFRHIAAFEMTFSDDAGADDALDLPEMELLVELMYGPGSYEGIRGLL